MSFASLVEPEPHESWSEEESSEERSDRSRLSRLMRSARGPGSCVCGYGRNPKRTPNRGFEQQQMCEC